MKQTTGFKIQAEDRQSWGAITMVWIGAMICVPALMIGGMIGAGLSLESAAIAIIIGYALICILMSFMGMHACDTGLPTAVMAGGALGEMGCQVHHQYHSYHLLCWLVRHSGGCLRLLLFVYGGRHVRIQHPCMAFLRGLGHRHAADRLLPFQRAQMAQ